MFEYFTDPSRRILVIARDSAASLEFRYVGSEHLLLALRSADGIVPDVASIRLVTGIFDWFNLTHDAIKGQVEARDRGNDREGSEPGGLAFTADAVAIVRQVALTIAFARGCRWIEPTHILLALLDPSMSSSAAAEILTNLRVDKDVLYKEVLGTIADRERGLGVSA